MAIEIKGKGSPVGDGTIHPNNSLENAEIQQLIFAYKRSVASKYSGVTEDSINGDIVPGKYWVSPKIDGQLWFLIAQDGDVVLANPRGRVLSGKLPLLAEAKKTVGNKASDCTVIAGELFAIGPRPRVGDITSLLSENGDVRKIAFSAFDLLQGGNVETLPEDYGERHAILEDLLEGGKRVKAVTTEVCTNAGEVSALFTKFAGGTEAKAEGLIARNAQGRIFKIKPQFNIDLAVIGFTQRSDDPDQVRSLLLALIRQDGKFQIVGSCGNLGTDKNRKKLFKSLSSTIKPSNYRYASSSGAVYKFVDPQMVVEVKCNDIQSEDSSGDPLRRMTLEYTDGWTAIQNLPAASLIHPVLERVRDDKEVSETDVRISQLEVRCYIENLNAKAEVVSLPKSKILKRNVYIKVSKGITSVRKVVMWKTNKEVEDENFPPFVVHYTDYSPTRKKPLNRDVEVATNEEDATAIFDEYDKNGAKRGWNPA